MGLLLTRVEGEGEIHVYVREGRLQDVEVRITEAPRFFEYIVVGRRPIDVPDIVSRICGLCGVSYILTAVRAFERGLSIEVPEQVELYRRALHGAERIKSHILHAYFMHLPDLVEVRGSDELFQRNPQLFRDAFRVLEWSRKAMTVLGGRFHNVVSIRIGGVYGYPRREEVAKILRDVADVERSLLRLADFVLSLDIPSFRQDMKFLALYDRSEYPEMAEKVALYDYSGSVEFYDLKDFEKIVRVEQKPYSNALRYRLTSGDPYVVGPLARFNIGYRHLRGEVRDKLEEHGWRAPLVNVYQSIVARIAETYNTLLFLKEFAEGYKEPVAEIAEVKVGPGEYLAAVEAPRGILYHRYVVDANGRISYANIVTPTAQNLAAMERLISGTVHQSSAVSEEIVLRVGAEIVRCFDPCISCSVHTVKVHVIQ